MPNYHNLFSTHPSFLLERLIKQYQKQDRLVIAYDFDDTVSPYWCADCSDVQSILRMCRNTLNAYFICYTSNNDIEKVKKFVEKYDLPFILLSNEELDVLKEYEVWGEKKLYGKAYMGVLRTTYVINEQGVIEIVYEKVKHDTNAEEVLCEL